MIPFKYILISRTTSNICHTVRFAYRKMKDGKKLCSSIKLRKKEIFEDG